jgi:beta-glucanase (GH16 family)
MTYSRSLHSNLFTEETGAHGWGNNESQNYTSSPENSFFTPDNKLVLRAIANSSSSGDKFTSARLFTHKKLDRQRGCLSAVITAPCAPGIWPAFWLLPADPFSWPNDGEIDIFESWNGDCVNHSCLHWGHYNGEDWNKHRVVETPIPSMGHEAHKFDLAWEQGEDGRGGRLVWYIDGNAVMKASIPEGTRRMSDWRIILNVAMGGNVCGGRLPANGVYDFVVHELKMEEGPSAGWGQFGVDWERTREGKTM